MTRHTTRARKIRLETVFHFPLSGKYWIFFFLSPFLPDGCRLFPFAHGYCTIPVMLCSRASRYLQRSSLRHPSAGIFALLHAAAANLHKNENTQTSEVKTFASSILEL
uniref:Uncharacterized protein n=1 Tax=Daphnia magna TaxID=35525 RepID=A0A0P4XH79_9CRUS